MKKICLIDGCDMCPYCVNRGAGHWMCTHSEGKTISAGPNNIPDWCPLEDYDPFQSTL